MDARRAREHPRLLIVEGQDDLFSVVGLMRHNVDWPERVDDCPVYIKVGSSVDEILKPGYLTAQLKASHRRFVGVLLDSDDRAGGGRYLRVRQLGGDLFPELPKTMGGDGLIAENSAGKRLGLWVMPDNFTEGCMETFLKHLVPSNAKDVWDLAARSVKTARATGAPCRDAHVPKAELFTWLAWQDPPGYSPGMALTKKILDPHSPSAFAFVKWFRDLYQL